MRVTYWNENIAGGATTYEELVAFETGDGGAASTTHDGVSEKELERVIEVFEDESYSTLHIHIHPSILVQSKIYVLIARYFQRRVSL